MTQDSPNQGKQIKSKMNYELKKRIKMRDELQRCAHIVQHMQYKSNSTE